MTDLLKELEAVALLAEKATPGEWHRHTDCPAECCWHMFTAPDGIYGDGDGDLINSPEMGESDAAYIVALSNLFRTHHAEIAEAVRDAERWRALHWGEAPMVTVTGSQLARGIRPGDFAVPWDWPVTSKTRVRMIVMNNSAREVGE